MALLLGQAPEILYTAEDFVEAARLGEVLLLDKILLSGMNPNTVNVWKQFQLIFYLPKTNNPCSRNMVSLLCCLRRNIGKKMQQDIYLQKEQIQMVIRYMLIY